MLYGAFLTFFEAILSSFLEKVKAGESLARPRLVAMHPPGASGGFAGSNFVGA